MRNENWSDSRRQLQAKPGALTISSWLPRLSPRQRGGGVRAVGDTGEPTTRLPSSGRQYDAVTAGPDAPGDRGAARNRRADWRTSGRDSPAGSFAEGSGAGAQLSAP